MMMIVMMEVNTEVVNNEVVKKVVEEIYCQESDVEVHGT